MKRKLTLTFVAGGGVFVPLIQDWMAHAIRASLTPTTSSRIPEAVSIGTVTVLFLILFVGAQALLDLAFRHSLAVRKWVFGKRWIEGQWKDSPNPAHGVSNSADVDFSYQENGDVKVVGQVFRGDKPLYRFESIKSAMKGDDLQFMYRTLGPAVRNEAYGFACFTFWGREKIPDLYTGYFVDTEGPGRVEVEGRKVR